MSKNNIYSYIKDRVSKEYFLEMLSSGGNVGVTAEDIAEEFGLHRSNASAALNRLAKDGKLVKTHNRPVCFLPADIFLPDVSLQHKSSFTLEELGELLGAELKDKSMQENLFASVEMPEIDPFFGIIGCDGSLQEQINQAKAAIMYPPHGLHTLIIGESGTGKTLFSKAMYNYGLAAKGKLSGQYPYVAFNCADYYNNPQLLMSHLFGHVKGAFTGAEKEKTGMVEKADGGILFLDEIHRLPPEGQELLFYLMDKGQYRKLGESDGVRNARVQIIGATTESPENVLLGTFKRRIPVTIRLSPFRERPIYEKIKAVETFFINESSAIQRGFVLKPPIVKALASYEYPGNMGELASEIKVLCARTFLGSSARDTSLTVQYQYLSVSLRENYRRLSKEQQNFDNKYDYDISIKPDRSIKYSFGYEFEESSYLQLLENINYHTKNGSLQEDVEKALSGKLREYYSHVLNKLGHGKIYRDAMYKAVDKEIVDFTEKALSRTVSTLDIVLSQKNILVIAFHIKYLLERIKEPRPSSKTASHSQVKKEFSNELAAAQRVVQDIEEYFGVEVPPDEKYIIAILLGNMKEEKPQVNSKLYILAHGNSTASSIAEVCCKLMDCDFVQGIDAPLEQSVEETYKRLLHEIRISSREEGVIILADMGSLLQMGERVSKELGIPVFTIPDVTTLSALDITRMLCRSSDVEKVYKEYITRKGACAPLRKKGGIIITYCASGIGTGSAFKSMIEEELARVNTHNIMVAALTYQDIKSCTQRYATLEKEYNIIALVGNIENDTDKPFFHITELLTPKGREEFISFVNGTAAADLTGDDSEEEDIRKKGVKFLARHVACINPELAVNYAVKYIEAVNIPQLNEDKALRLSFIFHIGFMLERNIMRHKVVFGGMEEYIKENPEMFRKFREHIKILEEPFMVEINDCEICFMIKTTKVKKRGKN